MLSSNASISLSFAYGLSAISGLLIALSFVFSELYIFAWFGFGPLLFSVLRSTGVQAYWLGLLSGTVMVVVATPWVLDFIQTLKGYGIGSAIFLASIVWLWTAQALALAMLTLKWLSSRTKFPLYLVAPCLLTLSFNPGMGLFTVSLASSQTDFLVVLQALDVIGVYGVDFVIAFVNVVVYQTLCTQKPDWRVVVAAPLLVGIVCGYGFWALSTWRGQVKAADSLRVGVVQPNERPSAQVPPPVGGFSRAFPPELAMSQALEAEAVDLIVWPETRHRGYFFHEHVADAYRYYVASWQTPLIFQDNETVMREGQVERFNSSVFLNREGSEAAVYRKIKRIPVGESVPLFSENERVKAVLTSWLGDFFSDLNAGDGPVYFHLDSPKPVTIVPLICYELIFPTFVQKAVAQVEPDSARVTVLLGQSNNAWFGEGFQPYQHLRVSVLRSIENRAPLVYSSNSGPSAVISPSGDILAQTPVGEIGAYVFQLPLTPAGNILSAPKFFTLWSLWLLVALAFIDGFLRRTKG